MNYVLSAYAIAALFLGGYTLVLYARKKKIAEEFAFLQNIDRKQK